MAPDINRVLEIVSIASALSSALSIYPCQIRVHQTLTVLNSIFLQLGIRSCGRPQRTVYPRRLPVSCDTHYVSRHRTHNLPIVSPICMISVISVILPNQKSVFCMQSSML